MKILLRKWNDEHYVWKTAKYNNNHFYVNGNEVNEVEIVSIVNDNRKKYFQCSCCGQVFRKGDPRFETHKENALKPSACFDCPHLSVHRLSHKVPKYVMAPDGTYREKVEYAVTLECSKTGVWSYDSIDSDSAIESCKKRQCYNATEVEIQDFFTDYPGVFDDIITVDALLDNGYDVNLRVGSITHTITDEWSYTIEAYINKLGIVDHFVIYYGDGKYDVYYSKRYHKLFCYCGGYAEWSIYNMDEKTETEIKEEIARLYN